MSCCLWRGGSHTPASLTRLRASSTRTHANRLSSSPKARRLAAELCLYCASLEHIIRICPVRPPRPAVSTLQMDTAVSTLSLLPVELRTPESSVSVSALVNSDSSGNFISQALLTRLSLPVSGSPGSSESRLFKEKPLGRGKGLIIELPLWHSESDVCTKKPSHF